VSAEHAIFVPAERFFHIEDPPYRRALMVAEVRFHIEHKIWREVSDLVSIGIDVRVVGRSKLQKVYTLYFNDGFESEVVIDLELVCNG
jgi:hypothetical protein